MDQGHRLRVRIPTTIAIGTAALTVGMALPAMASPGTARTTSLVMHSQSNSPNALSSTLTITIPGGISAGQASSIRKAVTGFAPVVPAGIFAQAGPATLGPGAPKPAGPGPQYAALRCNGSYWWGDVD